jgi:hypothetical protein
MKNEEEVEDDLSSENKTFFIDEPYDRSEVMSEHEGSVATKANAGTVVKDEPGDRSESSSEDVEALVDNTEENSGDDEELKDESRRIMKMEQK